MKPFTIRILAEPEDVEGAVNLMLTGLLGRPVDWKQSRRYKPRGKYRRRQSTKERVYVTVYPEGYEPRRRGDVFELGEYDIEVS